MPRWVPVTGSGYLYFRLTMRSTVYWKLILPREAFRHTSVSQEMKPERNATPTIPIVEDPSPRTTIVTWAAVTLFLALIVAATAPFFAFLGDSAYALVSTIHGLLATLGVLVGTITAYLGWRLFIGKLRAFIDLKLLSIVSALVSAGTIFFGNWIYIGYRAAGGPRAYFLANNPEIHSIFFEFKEFIALFTLPVAVSVAFVMWRYDRQILEERGLRSWLGIAFAIGWAALMIAFLLGAAITKVRSI